MDTQLPGVRSLLEAAWSTYRERCVTAVACLLLPAVVQGSGQVLVSLSPSGLPLVLGSALSLLGGLGVAVGTLAAIYILSDSALTARPAWDRALPLLLPLIWLGLVGGFFIIGGFLLFIVPGLLYLVWFSVAVVAFAHEDVRGVGALRRSRQLVCGRFWSVAWRLVPLLVIGLAFNLLAAPFGESGSIGRTVADAFGTALLVPFGYAYLSGLYRGLAAASAPAEPLPLSKKLSLAAVPLLGWLVGGAIVIAALTVGPRIEQLDSTLGATIRDAEREATVRSVLQPVLAEHYAHRGRYPSALAIDQIGEWVQAIPTEPGGQPHDYTLTDAGHGYTICPRFERRPRACFGPPSR